MQFANFRVLKRITGHTLITRNYTVLFVRSFILLFAILAASHAVFWYNGQANDNAFVIAIDTSASMQAQDISPSRIEAAKNDARLFIESVSSETAFGLVSFSGVTFVESPLTKDKNEILKAIDDIKPVDAGGTDIPGALITGANLLLATDKGRVVILITDGSNTLETFASDSVQQGVNYVQEQHVIVHTIGIGTDTGPVGYLPTYYNISSIYNQENLEYIANQTGGVYLKAESRDELLAAYESIGLESKQSLLKVDLAPGLTLLVLALLFFEWGIISTRFRSIP